MSELNPQQQAAVEYHDGHLLIVAGPGTGKTHTVTKKIAALLQKKLAAPDQIVAVTFTRKAGEQLTQRLKKMLPEEQQLPFAGTFHSFCLQTLRTHAKKTWRILAQKEQQQLWESTGGDKEQYSQKLAELHALDFDGILAETVKLLRSDAALKQALHQKIRFLFVDEYQDVNDIQYDLIRELTGPDTKLCAIGDPDQAIYSFRGADVGHFLRFEQDFPGTKVLHLEQNYRSTPDIVECSNTLIRHNARRVHKNLRSTTRPGPRVAVMPCQTPLGEAIWVAKEIVRLVGGIDTASMDEKTGDDYEKHYHFTDIAVVYRTNVQGKLLATALKKEGLPYHRLAASPWFEEKEVKAVMLHLASAVDPQSIPPELEGFRAQYNALNHAFADNKPSRNLKKILETFHLEAPTGAEKSAENMLRLVNFAMQFDDRAGIEGMKILLDELTLLQEHDLYDERLQAVTLMSIHASKGLEFPVVFMAGVEEGTLPYAQPQADSRHHNASHFDPQSHIEEERRLMYVGLTRAKERLFLTYSRTRRENAVRPSPFLEEITQHLLELQPRKRNNKTLWKKKQLTIF